MPNQTRQWIQKHFRPIVDLREISVLQWILFMFFLPRNLENTQCVKFKNVGDSQILLHSNNQTSSSRQLQKAINEEQQRLRRNGAKMEIKFIRSREDRQISLYLENEPRRNGVQNFLGLAFDMYFSFRGHVEFISAREKSK